MLNIAEVRKEKSITIMDLADSVGVRAQTMTDKLNGVTEFKFSEALTLKEKYFPEYNIEFLFSNKEEK